MSRPLIAAMASALIAALCGVAYLVTSSRLESSIRHELRDRVAVAQDLLLRDAELESLELFGSARSLARDARVLRALSGDVANAEPAIRAFTDFRGKLAANRRPDIVALTDAGGRLVALLTGDQRVNNPIASSYLEGDAVKYPALALALSDRLRSVDVWAYEGQGPMEVAVAPVIDTTTDELVGAVLLAHDIGSERAERIGRQLGAGVAYFYGAEVYASGIDGELPAELFAAGGVGAEALASDRGIAQIVSITAGGREYIATAGRLPFLSSLGGRPPGYPPARAGAVVAASVDDALGGLASLKLAIALVGLGAVVVMLLAMFVTARQILGPVDELEVGVAEMLDGNLDVTFEPSGADLDGLANGLNVLLSRLLGRPEPGEVEYDRDGEVIQSSASVRFAAQSAPEHDAAARALASEPEADYYGRIYAEYTAAVRHTGGSVAGLTMEAFINKLRLNETTLREKYQATDVRFVVAVEDGQVILRPVPIR